MPAHPIAVRFLSLVALVALLIPVSAVTAQTETPIAISLPADDAPHDVPIEWWYYTGHLFTANGDRYGFEFVVFKGNRGDLHAYAAHFAITDTAHDHFAYAQRLAAVPDSDSTAPGFELVVLDWRMSGNDGEDHLVATMDTYAIDLTTTPEKPPVRHDGDGSIDYGSAGASYYYSRTRQVITGTLTIDGQPRSVTGEAWFDHQWGNFTTFTAGGWDWYSVQLDDGTDLMLYVVHLTDGSPPIVDGSLIAPDGSLTILDDTDFTLTPTDSWASPTSGITYASGWTVDVPTQNITLDLTPSRQNQELDTRLTTGLIYWEGEVTVTGTHSGAPVSGLGYVELTGLSN